MSKARLKETGKIVEIMPITIYYVLDENNKIYADCDRDEFEFLDEREDSEKDKIVSVIQWRGNNLKEVVEFTGKSPRFEEWFKSWDEYETYVREHNNIFKLFNEDGSHYEVPVGAWIVKTPDGYNVSSKATFVPSTRGKETRYIDAEKLITDIKRKIESIENCPFQIAYFGEEKKSEGELIAYKDALSIITSLQQEQSDVDLDREIIKYKVPFTDESEYLNETTLDAIARHFAEWGAIHLNARKEE